MTKPKIYVLLAYQPFLQADKGDKINEINTYRILAENFDVYYNNRKFNYNDKKFFGTNPSDKISLPDKDYDLYYVRNNPEIFLELPHPKIYFALPNQQECFKVADGLVFPTRAWAEAMDDLSLGLDKIYSKEDFIPKQKIVFNQLCEPNGYAGNPKIKMLKKVFGNKFLIGHFGRVHSSNPPNPYVRRTNKEEVLYVGSPKRIPWAKTLHFLRNSEVKYYISACDAILYNQDAQGEYCGSLKVMDALAAGVPIFTPRYKARMDELGENYPFYYDKEQLSSTFIRECVGKYPEIRNYLSERAKYFTLQESAKRYYEQLKPLIQ